MKSLRESFDGNELKNYIYEQRDINEGAIGDFFKKSFMYLKSKIAKIGDFFVALYNDKVLPAITPIASQMALKSGSVRDTKYLHWVGNSIDKKYTGVDTTGAELLASRESTIDMWKRAAHILKESAPKSLANILETLKLRSDDTQVRDIDGAELERLVAMVIRKGAAAKPLLIWGAPGVGKTAIVNKVLKTIKGADSRMLDMQLSMKEHDDFFLPTYTVDKTKAVDVPKSYLPVWEDRDDMTDEERKAADEACGTGLLFLDELSRAKPQVQDVCLKLIGERKLGDKCKLGSGWSVIAASNRLEDDEDSQYKLSAALANRFRQVNYSPTCKSWRSWADKQGYMNKHVLDWLEQNEKYFYYQDNDETTIFATPRAWEAACQALADESYTADEEGFDLMSLPDDVIMAAVQDNVGLTAAMAFMDYVKLMRTVDMETLRKVTTDPDKVPLPAKQGATYKLDLLYIITTTIISFFKKIPTADEFTNCCKYFVRLNDMSAACNFLKKLFMKFPDMNNHLGEEGSESDMYLPGIMEFEKAYPDWANADFSN